VLATGVTLYRIVAQSRQPVDAVQAKERLTGSCSVLRENSFPYRYKRIYDGHVVVSRDE
jgi:hypothetical protein